MKIEESLLHVSEHIQKENWKSYSWTDQKAFVCSVMANLAYTKISEWELEEHSNVKLLPSHTYYELLKSKRINSQKYFSLLKTDEHLLIERPGAVLVATKINNVVFIAMRGTRLLSISDWRVNLNAKKVSPFPPHQGVKVHKGFYLEAKSFHEELVDEMHKREWDKFPVYFVGHSLGGALAAITYAMYDNYWLTSNVHRRLLRNNHCACYTFGMPRWGNANAIAVLKSPTHFFVENDPVPHVPTTSLGYSDCTNNISIDSNSFSYVKYNGLLVQIKDYLHLTVSNKFKDHFIETYVERLFQKL
ncbi:mono- and diacylglycerol lipase [Vibrio mimicus]|uniref:lipase family protein n=1 Tax=Vibrio mimicus TaxID=674 RepID=UPI0002B9C392|nr:lipase family protein [Vibrio mimicus]EMB48641.1 lipase, class 3 [Vibrio mimicus CAIM 602]MBY7676508.1 lipase family protein [Vibrio mimicus]MBY7728486.1 lipase family protein [Vibrio mimicus]TXY29489.1 lipase family protein [Vibrio mimicus]SUQ23510.1 mono- and diacylglycerol lipase [Vibrio mimicus]